MLASKVGDKMAEEYEVIPHKLLNDLKYDVEALQKKLTAPDSKSQELILEIESLKESIKELQNVFHKALDEMKEEDIYSALNKRLDSVVKQSETIAHGMVAIAEKLDNFISSSASAPKVAVPGQHTMGNPAQNRVAPPIGHSFPPPPPKVERRKHHLGMFK